MFNNPDYTGEYFSVLQKRQNPHDGGFQNAFMSVISLAIQLCEAYWN
ncbi:hypothetical protein FORC52_2373 [Salmonella enterica subsp. enterica serovar Enteritidis]|uniref:Uncharacterized protein n=1 Tax=Salmonella enteritidis (strain 2009K0958) TaxID=1192586 RepID=A0A656IAZ6_SALE2|nr:hypothetical protein FORC52_2373 [Salmonella enterica subsp. enterica serovar Enteritidis]ATD44697.1 hypothetical protein FORC51_2481 [Salmonella enterica]AUC49415.1 Thiazole biosynthesis protein ThiG [Salmonella enterica subsp. enterica serovar Typhimurium]EPI64741.1 hypothetical protein A673_04272 [Salmonella enterica subsp. enterica serovar Enteritidis str. 2009K0958]EPI65922.1 hypothetical protein A672_04196 [Salmonella enterica subsp. enterica serovar Enteritidis str. 08-1080]EPI79811.